MDLPGVSLKTDGSRITGTVGERPLSVTADAVVPSLLGRLALRGRRSALVVSTSVYADPSLQALAGAAGRTSTLLQPLFDPEVGNFPPSPGVSDQRAATVVQEIERFFAGREPSDVLLLYLSCVAVHENGQLYFAATDTDLEAPASASLSASFLHAQIACCATERVVVILDCSFTAAFAPHGPRPGEWIDVASLFPKTGRAMIVAPPVLRDPADGASPARSRDLAAILNRGIRDGAADVTEDGLVTADEIFDFLRTGVEAETNGETALILDPGPGRRFVVARRGGLPRPRIKEVKFERPAGDGPQPRHHPPDEGAQRAPSSGARTSPDPSPDAGDQPGSPLDGPGEAVGGPPSGNPLLDRIRASRALQDEGSTPSNAPPPFPRRGGGAEIDGLGGGASPRSLSPRGGVGDVVGGRNWQPPATPAPGRPASAVAARAARRHLPSLLRRIAVSGTAAVIAAGCAAGAAVVLTNGGDENGGARPEVSSPARLVGTDAASPSDATKDEVVVPRATTTRPAPVQPALPPESEPAPVPAPPAAPEPGPAAGVALPPERKPDGGVTAAGDTPAKCIEGFVWRLARLTDYVCVQPWVQAQAAEDNKLGPSRIDPKGGEYGPEQCLTEFVWREAFFGDRVCVSPETREQTRFDNLEGVQQDRQIPA